MQVDAQTSPTGFIEPFVYSKDRQKLLNTLVEDTEERVYYTFIQLDNEIETILKTNPNDSATIGKLLSSFDSLVEKIKKSQSLKNSSRLKNLMTRNNLRFIEYNDERKKIGWKEINDKLSYYPSHNKPKKKRLGQDINDVQYPSKVNCFGVPSKLQEHFNYCVKHNYTLYSYFEYNSINYLTCNSRIKSLTPKLIAQLLEWKSIIYISEKKLFQLIQIDFKKNKISFGSRSIHRKLTLKQLNKLYALMPDVLSSNSTFLQTILDKSIPPSLMRYNSFNDWVMDAPDVYKQQYNVIINNFIIKHLTLPIHQTWKCALLHYLINDEYEKSGTFNSNLLFEYLRIPKRRTYNGQIWIYYDSYEKRYKIQQEKIKRKKHLSTQQQSSTAAATKPDAVKTNDANEGQQKDIDGKLDKIDYIGSLGTSPVHRSASFGSFRCSDGGTLIKNALKYFFENPTKLEDSLSDEYKEYVKTDTTKFKKLKKEFKNYEKIQKKKMLSELQQKKLKQTQLQQKPVSYRSYGSSYGPPRPPRNRNMNRNNYNNALDDLFGLDDDNNNNDDIFIGGADEPSDSDDDDDDDEEVEQMYNDAPLVSIPKPILPPTIPPNDADNKEEKEMEFIDSSSYLAISYFLPYISRDYLLKEQSEYELRTGNNVTQPQAYRHLIKLKSLSYVQSLKDSVIIDYDKYKNPKKYQIDDNVILNVRLKNVKKLLLKVFKMNTRPFFKKNKSEVASDLNLEGLSATTLDKEIVVNITNEFQIQNLKIPLPSLTGKRGLYFVDVIGNGKHSRGIIRKGDFKYISRRGPAGHVLRVLDENHSVIKKSTIWCDNHTYKSNDKGDVYIPYSNKTGADKIIFASPQWPNYNVLGEIIRKSETYRLECAMYVDRESLLEKQESNVIIKCALFINSCKVTLKLLKSVVLDLSITTLQGVTVNKKFPSFHLNDVQDGIAKFALPNNPRSINFKLTCRVKKTDGEYKSFTKTQSYNINSIDTGKGIATAHLIPYKNNSCIISVLGKNGEPLPNILCTLTYKYFQIRSTMNKTVQSDKNGQILLPNMNGIKTLTIRCANNTSNYSFPLNKCIAPTKIHINQKEGFRIPYFSNNNILKDDDITFKLFDKKYSVNYDNNIIYKNGSFICEKGLNAGTYLLHADYNDYQCEIYVTRADNIIKMHRTTYAIENAPETFTVLSNSNPLQIETIEQSNNNNKIKIKIIGGHKDSIRVHAFLTHKYPSFPIFNRIRSIPIETTEMVDFNSAPSVYTSQRTISEEYRYVLERKTAKKYIGNMLAKPTLLLRPWSSRATKTKSKDAAKGDNIEHKKYRKRRRPQPPSLRTHPSGSMSESGNYSNLEFLAKSPSKAFINLRIDKDGYAEIDKKLIHNNHTFITVVAADNERWSIKTAILDKIDDNIIIKDDKKDDKKVDDLQIDLPVYKYSEVRLFPGLDINKHFTEQREIILLYNNDKFLVTNFKNSQCEVFVSLRDIHSLYTTLTKNAYLEKFSFLLRWDTLNDDKKAKLLTLNFCHETNFYLYCKHRKYFDKFIKPFLRNKIEKSFMDYWLLGDDKNLLNYTSFGEFDKLNCLEQILLAYVFKNNKKENYITKNTLNYFNERNKSLKISPSQLQDLFKKALADRHYADAMRKMANKEKERKKKEKDKLLQLHSGNIPMMSAATNMDARFLNESIQLMSMAQPQFAQQQQQVQQFAQQQIQFAQQQQMQQFAQQMPQANYMNMNQARHRPQRMQMAQRPLRAQRRRPAPQRQHRRQRSIEMKMPPPAPSSTFSSIPTSSPSSVSISSRNRANDDSDSSDDEADPFDLDLRYREIGKSFFRELENTKEYQECHYYKHPWSSTTKNKVQINKFWCDFAEYLLSDNKNQKKKPFLSRNFFLAKNSFTEMIFALSVLDLPVDIKNDNEQAIKDKNLDTLQMTVSCKNPCIVFSKQLKETAISASSTIHVAVHYFDPDDRHKTIDGERVDKFIDPSSFEPTKIYGCRAIITNSSSAQQRIEVLYQIPTGSIPVQKGSYIKTKFETISSYSGTNLEFYFYFPAPGIFRMFPVQISKKGRVLGFGKTKQIKVSFPVPTTVINKQDWDEVSIMGSSDDILNYLRNNNLYDTSLSRIYWKLKDKLFFLNITKFLRSKIYYDFTIWQYALRHKQLNEIKEIIERQSQFSNYFKPSFYSSWYKYDGIKNKNYSYLEYYPLINARAHQLGKKRTINNSRFSSQYRLFLEHALYQGNNINNLPLYVLLQSVYYLLIQDRIDESIEIFKLIDEDKIKLLYSVQYDYLNAYLNIYNENDKSCKIARKVVTKYKNIKYLSSNMRKLIDEVESQLSELQLDDDDDDDKKNDDDDDNDNDDDDVNNMTEKERLQKLIQPSMDFEIRDRNIQFTFHKINRVQISFYKMDIELLFSMSPFLRSNNDIFSYIQPNETLIVDLPADKKLHNVAIPKILQHTNMYINVSCIDPLDVTTPISQAFYDHQLIVEIKDRYGVLRVLDREQWINVQKAYIKVYALVNGTAKFHKDGYTDRRGQFDYVSVSCEHLTSTNKFAVLISTKKYGSMVKIVTIPSDLLQSSSTTSTSSSNDKMSSKPRIQSRGFKKKKVRMSKMSYK